MFTRWFPCVFRAWFRQRGWRPHRHQLEVAFRGWKGADVLLLAPTGGGKTLAGFLPALVELLTRLPISQSKAGASSPHSGSASPAMNGIQVLYLSPLKSLTADIQRNLEAPIREMGLGMLGLRCECRTGDTPARERARQKKHPPHILLTTPESLALMLSQEEAGERFSSLRWIIVDEVHALADNKRGDLLSLNLARLRVLCPEVRWVALSATVADPQELQVYLSPHAPERIELVDAYRPAVRRGRSSGREMVPPKVELLIPEGRLPWGGHSGRYALGAVMELIRSHQTTLVFVNTRAQAEMTYQELQEINKENLPMTLHHGSLDREHRAEMEDALARGEFRAVVATAALDLGVDWASVDLVVQIGPPKGVARLMQRIGRSNHRLDRASEARIVPTHRMEVLEAVAAMDAIREGELDNHFQRTGSVDVLIQHVLSRCCSDPVHPDALYAEVSKAGAYRTLTRAEFDVVVEFCSSGGYALRAYEAFKKLAVDTEGRLHIASPRLARLHRMNIGTIVAHPHLKVRMGRGRMLGEVEERFIQGLRKGDTFIFAGRLLRFEGMREMTVLVKPGKAECPKVPAFVGGNLPLSGPLARRVRGRIADRRGWESLPEQVREWLVHQERFSRIPGENAVLVESFPQRDRQYVVVHGFAGRAAHHTLGMLLTQRMEVLSLRPLGFNADDYAVCIGSLEGVMDESMVRELLDPGWMEKELEDWMMGSSLMKRTFREVAVVAGLIDRSRPGARRSGRSVTFSSDMIYEVLRTYEPGHVLLEATRCEADRGLIGTERLREEVARARRDLEFIRLPRISPFAVSVMSQVGREAVEGEAREFLLDRELEKLSAEAMGAMGKENVERGRIGF